MGPIWRGNGFVLRNDLWMFKENSTVGLLKWVEEQSILQITNCKNGHFELENKQAHPAICEKKGWFSCDSLSNEVEKLCFLSRVPGTPKAGVAPSSWASTQLRTSQMLLSDYSLFILTNPIFTSWHFYVFVVFYYIIIFPHFPVEFFKFVFFKIQMSYIHKVDVTILSLVFEFW